MPAYLTDTTHPALPRMAAHEFCNVCKSLDLCLDSTRSAWNACCRYTLNRLHFRVLQPITCTLRPQYPLPL
eukprot:XP_001690245.1 predicted protein [Chlamydomonas reinhardtii]